MNRVQGIEPRRRDVFLRLVYRMARRPLGVVPEPVRLWAHSRPLLVGYGALELAMERPGGLDPRLKQLAFLKAAALAGCEWCLDVGSALSRDAGIDERQLLELASHRDSTAFSEDERLVLDYAAAMTLTPCHVSNELFARLAARFGERELVELTAAVALENLRARFNWALGVRAEGFSAGTACVRPEAPLAAAAR